MNINSPCIAFNTICVIESLLGNSIYRFSLLFFLTAALLAQLGERRSAERKVASLNPGRTNTQGLKNN